MRPANLIPVEERAEQAQGFRSAPIAYLVVGALLLAVGAVTLLVVTDNQISSRKAEVAVASRQAESVEARASSLAAYTQFHQLTEQRDLAISNLAKSRFDWEKVMRQLGLVLPPGVRITNLTGTARPDISVGGGESVALRASVPGPAITMAGCAASQEVVAVFITALREIDGVTRVGVQNSESGNGDASSVSASGGCDSGTHFQLVVAFDAAPIPAAIGGGEAVAAEEPAAEPAEAAPEGE
jgi:Tfp pilus assembly protein PilN